PGRRILGMAPFRVTRNANLDVDEESASDLLQAIEDELRHRRRGDVVRIEVSSRSSPELRERLLAAFDLDAEDLYLVDGPVSLARLLAIYGDSHDPVLKDPPLRPAVVALPSEAEPL